MTNKEATTRNIGLTFDFVNHLIDNPKLIGTLPDKFKLFFVESDFVNSETKVLSGNSKKIAERYVKVKNTFELAGTIPPQ